MTLIRSLLRYTSKLVQLQIAVLFFCLQCLNPTTGTHFTGQVFGCVE